MDRRLFYGKEQRDSRSRGAQLYHYGNIGNEPFEKASDPMNIGIPKNLISFSGMKAHIINL